MTRTIDILVYGASGKTGRQAAARLARAGVRLGLAGRDSAKLEAVRAEIGAPDAPIFAVAADDAEGMRALASAARVVLAMAGPYADSGEALVAACAAAGTHYADITGETPWVRRMIDRHDAAARRSGARLVSFCGFDSVPSDIGTWTLVRHLREIHGQGCASVQAFLGGRGGLNGGTAQSALGIADRGWLGELLDPALLSPGLAVGPEDADALGFFRDPELGRWTAPMVMSLINSRVVRRSHALCSARGLAYGAGFHYRETALLSERAGRFDALKISLSVRALLFGARFAPLRRLARRFTPKPGEGPSEAAMDGGFTRAILLGQGEGGARARLELSYPGDPGNRFTVASACAAALALAEGRDLPDSSGFLTPASGIGAPLLDQLAAAGVKITVA